MTCRLPPELTDDELSAALDNEADAVVLRHLEQCAYCAARLESARQAEHRLKAILQTRRQACPTPQQLGEYQLGLGSPADRETIRRHLEFCPRCQDEIETLRGFLEDMPSPKTQARVAPVRPLGRAMVMPLRAQVFSAGMAARGLNTWSVEATAGPITIFVEAKAVSQTRRMMLSGEVLPNEEGVWTGGLVEIRKSGEVEAIAVLDEDAEFRDRGPISIGQIDIQITAQNGPSVVLSSLTLPNVG